MIVKKIELLTALLLDRGFLRAFGIMESWGSLAWARRVVAYSWVLSLMDCSMTHVFREKSVRSIECWVAPNPISDDCPFRFWIEVIET